MEEARRRFPGSPASLDALCKRFDIDISARDKHGALLDAELLAAMYLELMGGPQDVLELTSESRNSMDVSENRKILTPRAHVPYEEELASHEEFLKKIKEPIWAKK